MINQSLTDDANLIEDKNNHPVSPDLNDPDYLDNMSDAPADTSEEEHSADELVEEAREILAMGDGETVDAFSKVESAREIYEELLHQYEDLAMTAEGEPKQRYEETADNIARKLSEANMLLNQEIN